MRSNRGRALVRWAWLITAVLALGVLVASVPAYLAHLGLVTEVERIRMAAAGLPPEFTDPLEFWFDLASMIAQLVSVAACLALSTIIFWRRPSERMAIVHSFFLLIYGVVVVGPLQALVELHPDRLSVVGTLEAILFAGWAVLFYLFPDGKYIPRWTRWLSLAYVPWALAYLFFPGYLVPTSNPEADQVVVLFAWNMFWPVTSLVAQVYRYRRVSNPVQRQQTKWVLLAFALLVVVILSLAGPFLYFLFQRPANPLTGMPALARFYGPLWSALVSAMPLAMGVAILRFRLFDIDFFLNRSLVYGLLTAAVVAAYAGAVCASQAIVQSSQTLGPVLLVTILLLLIVRPLRAGLQRAVNRLIPLPAREPAAPAKTAPVGPRLAAWRARSFELARPAWYILAAIALASLLASIPAYRRLLGVVTEQERFAGSLAGPPNLFSPSPQFEFWLDAPYNLLSFGAAALSLALAALIFWRRPREPIAFVASLTLLIYGIVMAGPLEFLLGQSLASQAVTYFAQMLLWGLLLFLLFIFPDGRFVPSWTRWFSLLLAPWAIALAVLLLVMPLASNLAPFFILYSLPSLAAPYAQWVRYRLVSDRVQRQQTKWVIVGFTAWILAGSVVTGAFIFLARQFLAPAAASPTAASLALMFAARLLWPASLTFVPISLTVAILRYRLFDVDVLINRALVYGGLSASIVGAYVLVVGGLGALLQTSNALAPVLLTAVGAAILFRPLRDQLQRGADRLTYGQGAALLKPFSPDDALRPPAQQPAPHATIQPKLHRPVPVQWPASLEQQQMPARGALAALPVAGGMLLLSLLLIVAGLLFGVRLVAAGQASSVEISGQILGAATILAFAVVGALIARRQPHNCIGWLFGAVGLLGGLMLFADSYSLAGLRTDWRGFLPGLDIARWLGLWTWIPVIVLPVTFILLLFPDGHLPSIRWRLLAWSTALALAAYTLLVAFHPGPGVEPRLEPNPFGINAVRQLEILYPAIALMLLLGIGGSVAAVIVRFRRSGGIERQQFKWLVYAAVLGLVINLFSLTLGAIWPQRAAALSELETALIGAALVAIVTAAGIAILRYRLYDIDVLINRTLVYGSLTIVVAGTYVIAVGYLSELFHASGSFILSLLATGLIAVFFQPARERLQRAANRLLYGERDDPYAVLSRLGQRLEATLAPEAVLPALAETIAQTLKLPYVAITLIHDWQAEPQIVAAYGLPSTVATRLPLNYQAEPVGEMLIAARGPGETFTPAEHRLLNDIARQARVAAHAVRLTADLQRSRERLVSAQEEERRRLRRDLHDGLGPQLASQTLTLTAALRLLRSSPDEAEALLAEAIRHAQDAVSDIRRVVYGLRPPALDDLGLAGALRALAAEFEASGVRFTVSVPEALPPLPAAVEVACYRIAQEALTNVVKHAQARNCALTLTAEAAAAVVLEVTDDGRGLLAERRAGVGLGSMRERAAELGGQFTIESGPSGGTCVLARLPIG